MQIYASQFAVWGIRLFGMPTVRKGNVIEILPEGAVQIIALEVVEACSGIRSLMTLMTLALVLVYFTRRNDTKLPSGWFDFLKNSDFWRGVILMFSAIPIAILTNAGRVTATGVLTYYYGKKATESVAHDLAGWLVYLVALVLLIGLNFFLRKFLKWKDGGGDFKSQISNLKKENIQNENSSFVTRNWQFVIVLVAVLFAGGLFINWFENRGEVAVERKPLSQISSELGKWKQRGSDIKFSEATESVLGTSADGIFTNNLHGVIVGGGGTILFTEDAGTTWNPAFVSDKDKAKLNSVFFINKSNGWAVGSKGKIYQTISGGRFWRLQDSKTTKTLNDIYFSNTAEGWAIGDDGTILHTTTAGNVWSEAGSGSTHKFEKIVFNGNKGWIVGFGGTILSYEAGNQALTERPKLTNR
ncbi:MAG: archaeosortase/exosortase family protein [Acidobacteriota bacterium]|nr:archaeosortase/exosortase family protein [Acidobacteriota bacterium]